jgi:hypothetical protein
MTTMQAKREVATQSRGMRPAEAGIYLGGVAPATLAKWRMRGVGPAYHKLAARIVIYTPEDCDEWLASRRRMSTSEVG